MPFMQPDVRHGTFYYFAETDEYHPPETMDMSSVAQDIATGWWARLSAPGFLDCTDWQGPYDSEEKALEELAETFDLCRNCWEQCWEGPDGDCEERE